MSRTHLVMGVEMVSITNELGTFTGESLKDAQAALRKAEKADEKRRAVGREHFAVAKCKAMEQAYWVLCRVANGEEMPRGFRLKDERHKEFNDAVKRVSNGFSGDQWQAAFSLPGKMQRLTFYDDKVTAIVENGAGWDFLMFRKEGDGPERCYAVGGHEDQFTYVDVPGVTREMFAVMKEVGA